jgi:hypothetical protein
MLAALALLLVVAAAACSDQVHTTVPAGGTDPGCTRLGRALPQTLLKHHRRKTDPASPALAAWGDPAIVLRCGVSPPGPTTDQCISVDGVDWVARPVDGGYDFTTYGREPAVQVLVPKHYAPEAFALTGLAAAVSGIPQGEHRCS